MSSSVETDKENDPMDDTDQLLDSTYNLGTTDAATIMGKCFHNSISIYKSSTNCTINALLVPYYCLAVSLNNKPSRPKPVLKPN